MSEVQYLINELHPHTDINLTAALLTYKMFYFTVSVYFCTKRDMNHYKRGHSWKLDIKEILVDPFFRNHL